MTMLAAIEPVDQVRPLPRRGWLPPALLAVLAVWAPARADIPPPAGFVETCTVERQCPRDEVDLCRASFRERDACSRRHAHDGFKLVCKTRGASVWTELWCRPAARVPAASAPAASAASAAKSR